MHPGTQATIDRPTVAVASGSGADLAATRVRDGALRFARFAYPPNELGYCGPNDHRALLEYGAEGVADAGLAQLARGFAGAWPYLELIARATGVADPLDERVVEAYWLGNGLLDRVDMQLFGRSLLDRFRRQTAGTWGHLAEAIPAGAVPNHAFHVFGVYPWVGLLRSGGEHPVHVLDRCRIRWGRVVSVDGDGVVVESQPLVFDGRRVSLGPPATEQVTRGVGGTGFVADLAPDDMVALHWGWVCDRLSRRQLANLRRYTARQLTITNERVAHPGPASTMG